MMLCYALLRMESLFAYAFACLSAFLAMRASVADDVSGGCGGGGGGGAGSSTNFSLCGQHLWF